MSVAPKEFRPVVVQLLQLLRHQLRLLHGTRQHGLLSNFSLSAASSGKYPTLSDLIRSRILFTYNISFVLPHKLTVAISSAIQQYLVEPTNLTCQPI